MVSIAICDDEPYFRETLMQNILDISFTEQLELFEFSSGEELLLSYEAGKEYDIILMDIEMPNSNGIEVAERIRKFASDTILIFISCHQSYVFSAFQVEAFRYLLKPISIENLKRELILALQRYYHTHAFYTVQGAGLQRAVEVKLIQYLEVSNHTIHVHIRDTTLTCKGKMEEEYKKLVSHGFVQCHRSFLVNARYIREIDKLAIILQSGINVPLSKTYRQGVLEAYQTFLTRYGI